MNSIGKIIDGFEWDYTGTISTIKGTGYQGKGISRSLFLKPNLTDIPAQLFACKISQSPNAAKAGKVVFKYFSFRFDKDAKYETLAPEGVTLETPLEDIRNQVVSKLSNIENEISLTISLPGSFTNVITADGEFAIYDEKLFADNGGEAPYYIKPETVMNVHLKGAVSQGNEYFQTKLSTTATSAEIFQKAAAGKVWGEDDSTPEATAPAGGAPLW